MLNAKISVTAAAREGARASSVLGEENSSQAYTVASAAANKYMGIGTLDADDVNGDGHKRKRHGQHQL